MMQVSILDSKVFGSSWRDDEMAALFTEEARFSGWCEVIATIAECQEDECLIPDGVGRRLASGLRSQTVDISEISKSYAETGHSLAGLMKAASKYLGADAQYLCYGTTVQDVTDTWTSIVFKRAWRILFTRLLEIEEILAEIVKTHRSTPMLGRTHGQAGAPITFGFKASVWMQETRRSLKRLRSCYHDITLVQLAGSVGALSAYGDSGVQLREKVAERLGLGKPLVSWTNSRDSWCEFFAIISMACSSFDKIAHEVYNLQRNEIDELREGRVSSQIGSITMPQKRNPEICEQVGTLARLVRHEFSALHESLVHENERDGRSWKAEWALIPDLLIKAGQCFAMAKQVLGNLEIDVLRMRSNIENEKGLPHAEALMMALAGKVGLATAREKVASLAKQTSVEKVSLRQSAMNEMSISALLSESDFDRIFEPAYQTGSCETMCDLALEDTTLGSKIDRDFLRNLGSR